MIDNIIIKEGQQITFEKDFTEKKSSNMPNYTEKYTEKYIKNKRYTVLSEEIFYKLKEFLIKKYDFFNNKKQCFVIKYEKNLGETLLIENMLGLLRIDKSVILKIVPNVFYLNNKNNKSNENIENRHIYEINKKNEEIFVVMLKNFYNLKSKKYNKSLSDKKETKSNKSKEENIIAEIFIELYLKEALKIISGGLKSRNSLNFLDENNLDFNIPENKIIKSILLKISKNSKESDNFKIAHKLLSHLENLDQSTDIYADFLTATEKNDLYYKNILKLTENFIKKEKYIKDSINLSRDILFDPKKLFESYIVNKLKKKLANKNLKVITKPKAKPLFSNIKNNFLIKPSLILNRPNNSENTILEIKWKSSNNQNENQVISKEDIYEFHFLAKKYNSKNVWAIYPRYNNTDNLETSLSSGFSSSFFSCGEEELNINIFFLDMSEFDMSLSRLAEKL